MVKNTFFLLGGALILQGCVLMEKFDDSTAAHFDRDKAISELSEEISTIGYDRQELIPGIDGFLNTAASLLERQAAVMTEYRTVTDSHTDVQAFLSANRIIANDPQRLQQAIDEFDAGAQNQDEKIGPKIKEYKQATSKISEANAKMTTEILFELAQSAIILSEHSNEVAAATGLSMLSSFSKNNNFLSGLNANSLSNNTNSNNTNQETEPTLEPADIGQALLKAKKQIQLANKANRLIDVDKKTIAAIENLERELAAK